MHNNFIKHIAIVGAGGQVGSHITKCLLETGKHTVTALTRAESSTNLPRGVRVAPVDYEDESSIVKALQNQQFLIITLANTAVRDTQPKLIQAAVKAGVSYVMPNWYGPDLANEKFVTELIVGFTALAAVKQIQEAGLKSIALSCGFWYEFSLGGGALGRGGGPERYGFDLVNRKVVLIDDGTQKINTSTLEQCGRAVAALLSLPEQSSDKPAVSHWTNKSVYCSSFTISQLDMLESVLRVTGTSNADWEVVQETSKARYDNSLKAWEGGDVKGLICASYTRNFFPDSAGNFDTTRGLDNSVLGLPEENLDDCTRRAVKPN